MKRLLLVLSLAISSLALEGQTARLECFNCTKLPNDVCLPCLAGTASSEYSQGIMYHQGPNSRVFIRKPYSVSVKGVFITLTDYTGKALTFDGTKTTHGSLTSVLNIINQCNCNIVGGGGPPGSFTISGDTGSGDVTGTLAITTGNTLRSVGANGSLLLDWDLTSASPHSIPYYTTGGTSNVNWRTFATGIVDDPTVGGADNTGLQTVLNNLNTAIGGGSGLAGDPRNIPYFNASGNPVDGNYFKLDSTSSGVILRIGNPNNYHPIVGTPLSVYSPKLQTYDNSAFGIERTFSSGGSGVVIGAAVNNPTLSFSHINGTYASPSNTAPGEIIGIIRGNARVSGNSQQAAASIFMRYTNNADATNTAYEIGFNAASSANAVISDALVIKGNGLYINGGGGDPQWYLPYLYPGTGVKSLKWVNNVPEWGDAPQAISKYSVTITGANPGSSLNVISYGTGVTAYFAANKLTITIPTGGRILAANWRLVASDVQASADAAGTTNWVQVEFVNSGLNTSLTDFNVPTLQKTAIPASGALSVTNAATMDLDNNPAMSVIGISSGTLTLRIGGLAVGSQGYLLTLNNL